ncbi:hypothetical protein VV02_16920 [Luteipulveratus mongoliensis]|uniref:Peptidase MA-like domain-containing protein n=1 Tax=Luteipulveratus mongoliensis TaxID=571913 RepID=A0A0K1JK93_9MICO|nr:hypothetical protein VV02_16920 [Luteipulveratus mongoliensis]
MLVAALSATMLVSGCSTTTSDDPPASSTTTSARPGVQVSGGAPAAQRAAYESQLVTAMRQVTQVWGTDWSSIPVRLVVAGSGTEFAEITGRPADGGVPAVTLADSRVVLHPKLWTSTTAAGRQVVLTHELTHVALGQGRLRGVPLWVIEGSAELTAYRASSLSTAQAAPTLSSQIRRGLVPTGPPSDAELRVTGGQTQPGAYQNAHAWCAFLVQRKGIRVFTDFVRRADAGDRGAFEKAYGVTPAALSKPYQAWLRGWS